MFTPDVIDNRVFMQGSSVASSKLFDLSKRSVDAPVLSNKRPNLMSAESYDGNITTGRKVQYHWLKAASSIYNISPDLKDYIILEVPIVTSDFPNLNCQAFQSSDLLSFDNVSGRLRYETFVGQPTFEDHENSILSEAKGVIFDATLVFIPKYKVYKVVALCGFDRSKDSKLVNGILTGRRNGYSMGARAFYFQCSVCDGILGPDITRTCTCLNTDFRDLSSLGRIVGDRIHYHSAKFFNYIEISSVSNPADFTAITTELL